MQRKWMAIAGLMLAGLVGAVWLNPGSSPAAMNNQSHQERTTLPMQRAKLPPGLKMPPVDAAVPAKTETATFALG
jgi:hypothetical protein